MTEHPLTDEICEKLADTEDRPFTDIEMDNMRAAADWQLEKVKEEVKRNLMLLRKAGYFFAADTSENFFEEIMKAMRPTTQEDN